jgi:hypothetical protein
MGKNIKILLLIWVIIFGFFGSEVWAKGFDHSHSGFAPLLKSNVKSGLFDYKSLAKDRSSLDTYLKTLQSVPESEYNTFSEKQKIAFLINAYNAFTLDLILKNYPVASIGDIGGPVRLINLARGTPWKSYTFPLLGANRNLDWIEHSKLRVDFKEPRIHFAINCASIGCPALRPEPYTATKLEAQLGDALVTFLKDRSKNRYDPEKNRLVLSPIFDWFASDFQKHSGSVLEFVKPYFPIQDPGSTKIEYSNYDWLLNEVK